MKKTPGKTPRRPDPDRDTLRSEYDFSKGVRGVTAARYVKGTNVVVLDPDVHAAFPTASAVNEALRALAEIAKRTRPPRSRKRSA